MDSKKVRITTSKEISKQSGLSLNALLRRCQRAMDNGYILIPRLGYYALSKPGKSYRFIKINKTGSAGQEARVRKELLEILEKLKDYQCDECSETISKMIHNIEA